MIRRETVFLAIAASLLASPAAAQQSDFVARGNEPGWIVRMNDASLTFETMGGAPVTIAPAPAAETIDGVKIYKATVDGQPFQVSVADELCVDTMSGMPHPATVSVESGGQHFQGCGGEPATLLHGEWTVSELDGKAVVAGSEVTLAFEAGGHLSGAASCNRYFAEFTLTGESLTVSKPGATMMMCDQPLMDQEALFMAILEGTTRFGIGADGSLVLHAGDGRTLTATRKS
jgi:heat shock protein HslJ